MIDYPPGWERCRVLIASLRGNLCPACRGGKGAAKSVCLACWRKLPRDKQNALYRKVGQGYEAAFDDAMRTLGVECPLLPEDEVNA